MLCNHLLRSTKTKFTVSHQYYVLGCWATRQQGQVDSGHVRGYTVPAFMLAGSAAFRKRLVAVKTALRHLAGMCSFVPGNIALLGEPPWAHGASVGLLPCVGPLVLGNVALVAEAPRAHRASVGLLTGVRRTSGRTPARNHTLARCA